MQINNILAPPSICLTLNFNHPCVGWNFHPTLPFHSTICLYYYNIIQITSAGVQLYWSFELLAFILYKIVHIWTLRQAFFASLFTHLDTLNMIIQEIKQFLELSTVHGLSYISTAKKWSRLFWILVVIGGFSGAGYLIHVSFDNWKQSPISTTIEILPISQITFPNVTVC